MEENEREQLGEELRQQILLEHMGQVPQAEIVLDDVKDDETSTRRRVLPCTGIVVIMLAIILGTVFGT